MQSINYHLKREERVEEAIQKYKYVYYMDFKMYSPDAGNLGLQERFLQRTCIQALTVTLWLSFSISSFSISDALFWHPQTHRKLMLADFALLFLYFLPHYEVLK